MTDHQDSLLPLEGGSLSRDLESRIRRALGRGHLVDPSLHEHLGMATSKDLSFVTFHTDSEATELARRLGARAFTIGSDVFFAQDAYQPRSDAGRRLITHELAHVMQQLADPAVGQDLRTIVRPATDVLERQADAFAENPHRLGELWPRTSRRVAAISTVIQRALADKVRNIDDRLPLQFRNCLNGVVLWIYEELGSGTGVVDALQEAPDKIARLAKKGNPVIYKKSKNMAVNAGDVLIFWDGHPRHACIAMTSSRIGGYNQAGWFAGAPLTEYFEAKLEGIFCREKELFGQNFACKLYKVSEHDALKVAKKW